MTTKALLYVRLAGLQLAELFNVFPMNASRLVRSSVETVC